jgi:hypothetical protein
MYQNNGRYGSYECRNWKQNAVNKIMLTVILKEMYILEYIIKMEKTA